MSNLLISSLPSLLEKRSGSNLFNSWVILLVLLVQSSNGLANANKDTDPEMLAFLSKNLEKQQQFNDKYDAQVWLLSMTEPLKPYIKDPQQRLELLQRIHWAANSAGLRPELVLAIIQIESSFRQYAISKVGAQGLMQIMPFWKEEIGRHDDNLMHIETNLQYGCYIFKYYLAKENGNIARALARYNGSLGKTHYSEKVMNAWADNWYHGQL